MKRLQEEAEKERQRAEDRKRKKQYFANYPISSKKSRALTSKFIKANQKYPYMYIAQREHDIFPNFQILEDQIIIEERNEKDLNQKKKRLSLSQDPDKKQLVTAGWYERQEALRIFNARLRSKRRPEKMTSAEYNAYVNQQNLRSAEKLHFYTEQSDSCKFGVKVYKSDVK